MKRLAELDSNNPSIVKESQNVEECGMMPEIGMGMGAMERPSTPASINMTAGSGEELSDMLATIMQLAGVKQHGEEEPMSTEPTLAIAAEPEMDANADMRSVMDLINPIWCGRMRLIRNPRYLFRYDAIDNHIKSVNFSTNYIISYW